MDGRDVVITGLGAICCLGRGVPRFWDGLLAGGGDPARVPDPLAHMKSPHKYLVPEEAVPREPVAVAHAPLGAGPRMGAAAAREAVADAGLDAAALERAAVVVGVEMGNAEMHEGDRPGQGPDGTRWRSMTVTTAAVSAAVGSAGESLSVGNACAASGYALSVAADMIRAGEVEVAVAGGADGGSRAALGAFNRMRAMDPVRCRPFDRDRAGTVFGDGAAMVVLESAEHAARRAAPVRAVLAAAEWSCDAHHITAPEPGGREIVDTMRRALGSAGLAPGEIAALIPHGTGTPLNDVIESRALRAVFGDHCDRLPLLNLKGMIGHTGGAAGAFAVMAGVLALRDGLVPAADPPVDQDPECEVLLPKGAPAAVEGRAVMVNAYAFGGTNASLVLTRGSGAGGAR
ncbi:beta-ketoacyl-[acyl-carrier-protein] synthase family protein [Actinomadura rugatobispora]|uniref:Beta-ketoacyl-[acyl-carrier-protein] synthase family protein n=1 Tax=Actinomadura rugatobispora TaxID=1994 RepID=A0ABW0ZXB9_9ACTN|nr:beta-ketoacyl-[acyl-carrier-protein] synthase family protein [Actinomadura rugatobispora]